MKYGNLFKSYMRIYEHIPSTNRCSTLPYKELKQMAKNMYYRVKEECNLFNDDNPLENYTRMSKAELSRAVYNALDYLFNY